MYNFYILAKTGCVFQIEQLTLNRIWSVILPFRENPAIAYIISLFNLLLFSIMNSITERIREIRSGRSISQEYMANELGIDTSSYHRLERGTSPLSVTRLGEIARILEVDVVQLIGTKEQPKNDLQEHPYVKHLEDEVRFLRQQVQEQIAKILSIQGNSGSQGPLEARRG